ncbi:MAG TPA: hypothetical protein IAC31_09215 [Candidatus Faecousia intestinigallinarum]|nr:hypothetical protein [Candidatus Faecousia intestinigallinarum]
MPASIGPVIKIDGEREFRASIRQINEEMKLLEAETRAATRAFDANGDEQGKLTKTSENLRREIKLQYERMALLEDAVAKASAKYGDGSIQATRLRTALFDTQATVSGLESDLADTTDQLNHFGEEMQEVGDETKSSSQDVLSFGDILKANLASGAILSAVKNLAGKILEIGKAAVESAADVRAENAQFEQTFSELESTARDVLESVSKESGVAATRIQGSFTKLYAFTKTTGADSAEALDIASRAMTAAADNAAYYDRSIEDVTESLQSFLKGNYENDAALGISATETTRNAAANKLYAKSFNELSESQKVDVLLSMVEAGNEASGALGQAAREADQWTNVTGELSEAGRQLLAVIGDPILTGLTPILQGITNTINAMIAPKPWEELSNKFSSLNSAIGDIEDEFASTTDAVKSTAFAAEIYVEQLKDLEQAGLDTERAQEKYRLTVEQLNDLIPELNLTISEETGLIEQSTDSILENVDAWKKRALQEAEQKKYGDLIAKQAEASVALADAKGKQINLETEEIVLRERLSELTQGWTEEQRQELYNLAAKNLQLDLSSLYTRNYTQAIEEGSESREDLIRQLEETYYALIENTTSQEYLTEKISEGEEAVSNYDAELEEAQANMQAYNESLYAAGAGQDTMSEKIQATQATLDALEQEYADAVAAARESIDSQIGLFDALSSESATSAQEIIANWESQRQAFSNYEANLKKAVELNLDDTLIQQLSDGSEESMQILNALVNDTDLSVDDINAAFAKTAEARDSVSEVLGDIHSDYTKQMDALIEEAGQDGIDIVDGVAGGVDRYAYRFTNAMSSLASAGSRAFCSYMAISSPSKLMKKDGGYTVEGAVLGVEERTRDFAAAMEGLAAAGHSAFLASELNRVADFAENHFLTNSPDMAGSVTNSTIRNYGGITISIQQQPGEDAQLLAERVSQILQQDIDREAVALYG